MRTIASDRAGRGQPPLTVQEAAFMSPTQYVQHLADWTEARIAAVTAQQEQRLATLEQRVNDLMHAHGHDDDE